MGNKNIFSKNRGRIIQFVKNNPNTTYREIRKKIKLHPERFFKGGIKEAFKKAGVKSPRTLKKKNREQRRKIIINFLKKNLEAGGQVIGKKTKISVSSCFKNIKEAYKKAGIEYPRGESYKLSVEEKRKIVINLIRENPYLTTSELAKKAKVKNIYRMFKNLEELYQKAGIKFVGQGEKIKNRKGREVIDYIKKNPRATQRDINKNCKTKIQEIFKRGIFEAYKKARIEYPFERLKLYGAALKEIKKRARNFENEIAIKLSGYGKVNKFVKTKRGVADIILERKNKKIIIEIKDYQNKEISISQIKQLNKYLEDLNSDIGILICHTKPKKDKFLIGRNKIFILEKQELDKISKLV